MTRLSALSSAALWLDQPRLVHGLTRAVPWALPVVGAAAALADARQAPATCRNATLLRDAAAMAGTVGAALVGARLFVPKASLTGLRTGLAQLRRELAGNDTAPAHRLRQTLDVAQRRMLSPVEVHRLRQTLHEWAPDAAQAEAHLNQIIPRPQAVTGREILGEIRDLSLLGLFPVLGGLAGGMAGNALAGEGCKRQMSSQVQEASFQYLANIVLCNVGAGVALSLLERTPLKHSRPARLAALTAGITLVGIIGGASIANFIGKNLLGPMLDQGPLDGLRSVGRRVREQGVASLWRGLNDQRHIEAVDVGLHADDFALVGVFSGLKWITPLLAGLYAVSGYRAGTGYRNGSPSSSHAAPRPEFAMVRPPLAAPQPLPVRPSPVFGTFAHRVAVR